MVWTDTSRLRALAGLLALASAGARCATSGTAAGRGGDRGMTLVANAEGARPRDARRRVALVIGNASYEHFGALANPVRDAVALHQLLLRMGFDSELVQDANVGRLRGAVRRFTRGIRADDIAVVYYSGHGVSVGGHNYLVPVDFNAACGPGLGEALDQGALSVDNLLGSLTERDAIKVLLFDACRNNPCAERARSLTRNLGASRTVGEGLAAVRVPANSVILYATELGNTASDDYDEAAGRSRHSPFTAALLRHLPEPEDVAMVARSVRIEVSDLTRDRQTPWMEESLRVRGVVLANAAPSAPARAPAPAPVAPVPAYVPPAPVPAAGTLHDPWPGSDPVRPPAPSVGLSVVRNMADPGWQNPPYTGRVYFGPLPFREEQPFLTVNASPWAWVALTVDDQPVTVLVNGNRPEATSTAGAGAVSLIPPRLGTYGVLPLTRGGTHVVEARCYREQGGAGLVGGTRWSTTVNVPAGAITPCD